MIWIRESTPWLDVSQQIVGNNRFIKE